MYTQHKTRTRTQTLHERMHTRGVTRACRAELYSQSSYKYLYRSRLIFISSDGAHTRGAAG